jgi:hypothetical protein
VNVLRQLNTSEQPPAPRTIELWRKGYQPVGVIAEGYQIVVGLSQVENLLGHNFLHDSLGEAFKGTLEACNKN